MHSLLLSVRSAYPSVVFASAVEPVDWVTGEPFATPPTALEFECRANLGFVWPDYLRPSSAIPLFSSRMRDALDRAGVETIDYYPARVTNTDTGESRLYHAANIIGRAVAMDRRRSVFEPARRHPVIVRSIDRLVIDESCCGALGVFRLVEYDPLVIINARVAGALAAAQLHAVRVIAPDQWDGLAD